MIIISRLSFVCLKKNYNAGITFGMGLGILLFCSGFSLSRYQLFAWFIQSKWIQEETSLAPRYMPILNHYTLNLLSCFSFRFAEYIATIRLSFSHSSTFYYQVQNDLKIFIAQLVNKVMPFLMKVTIFVWIMI